MDALTRLDAAAVATTVTALAESGCNHSDAELIDLITQLERLKNAAAAAQARATVELREIREAGARATGRSVKRVAASVAGEIGLARHESPHRGSVLVGLAAVLVGELPRTMAAFSAGEISEWRATLVARETACLSRADRAQVDAELAPQLAGMSTRQICAEARKAAYRLDPHSVVDRIGQAVKDRRVTCRPAPDCMTYVSALLPAVDGVAIIAALKQAADTARAAGDARSKGQMMADTLTARVTGKETATDIEVEIQLVITDEALLGDSDIPARLNGYGPIPAPIARGLAAEAVGKHQAWLRRLYVRPDQGRLIAMESTRRHFPKGMKAFIEARDEVCRTPWCGAPIRHTDHVTPVHAGGITSLTNGQGLCEQCNQIKEHPGWRHVVEPDGTVIVRTPTGHRHQSRPPDLPYEPKPAGFTVDFQHRRYAA
ncbi:MAG: DUF222 domain-containing protein [Micropruina sp.]|uniref:HNH endonuclease n=1 Tax=Micropruina sp. TaxID=2737536 RepID=UPI0039E4BB80